MHVCRFRTLKVISSAQISKSVNKISCIFRNSKFVKNTKKKLTDLSFSGEEPMTFFSFWVDVSFNTVLETLQSVSNEAEQNFKVECFLTPSITFVRFKS